ncbi:MULTISPECIES: hypothetical protein [Shewanella]
MIKYLKSSARKRNKLFEYY